MVSVWTPTRTDRPPGNHRQVGADMARGKYKSGAESRAAREQAIQTSEQLTRRCRQLEQELTTERAERAESESALRSRNTELYRQTMEGSSEALDQALANSAATKERLENRLESFSDRVLAVLKQYGFQMEPGGWEALMLAMDRVLETGRESRYLRRIKRNRPAQLLDITRQARDTPYFNDDPNP